jgi:hypothetical protein
MFSLIKNEFYRKVYSKKEKKENTVQWTNSYDTCFSDVSPG